MAALEPLDRDLRSGIIPHGRLLRRIFEGDVGIEPAGAAHIQLAFGLRIEVQQDIAAEQAFFQPEGTVHTGLLGCGKQGFEGAVHQRVVLQHGKDRRGADAVVGPERRAVGRDPFAVDVGVDGVFGEVELLIVVLLGHHVEVRLQDDALAVFHPFRGGLADIDVVRSVLLAFQSPGLGEIHDVLADLLLVRRGARDADDLREMLPDKRRFQRR